MGFQTARKTFDEVFTKTMVDINEMLAEQWARDNYVPVAEITKKTNKILVDNDVDRVVFDTAWETITSKTKPMVTDEMVPEGSNKSEWLLAFLLAWDSFGKLLPRRIRNTASLIRKEYKKNTARIYRDVYRATQSQDINAKIYGQGLSDAVKKRYHQEFERDRKKASEYLEEQFGRKAGKVADQKNRKLPRHYANRTTETEALTIRMDLALESAGKSKKIKYITISVKPDACSTCVGFIGHQYRFGTQPHLLAHPSCRCDYIVHYKNGQTMVIPGSGRVDLIK